MFQEYIDGTNNDNCVFSSWDVCLGYCLFIMAKIVLRYSFLVAVGHKLWKGGADGQKEGVINKWEG